MKESPTNHELLSKVVRYCSMTVKASVLDEYKVRAIEDLKEKKAHWEAILQKHASNLKEKGMDEMEKLSQWCSETFKLPSVTSNREIVKDAASFCTVAKVPR